MLAVQIPVRSSSARYRDRSSVARGSAWRPRIAGTRASSVSWRRWCPRLHARCCLRSAPRGESLYEALMLLFSCLTLGATLVLPRRDCSPANDRRNPLHSGFARCWRTPPKTCWSCSPPGFCPRSLFW